MHPVDVSRIRSAIDSIDQQIVALICERQKWVVEAGKVKRDQSTNSVRAPIRVEEVIGKVRTLASEAGASPDIVEGAYRALIAGFIDLELAVHKHEQGSA